MDNSLRVRGVERVGNLSRDAQDPVECEWLAGHQLLQRLPLQQLHDDELPVVVLADVVNGADVRMIQGRGGAGLTLETIDRMRMLRQFRRQELQRHVPLQARVLSAIDDTHPPTSQLLDDAIVGDGLADHFWRQGIVVRITTDVGRAAGEQPLGRQRGRRSGPHASILCAPCDRNSDSQPGSYLLAAVTLMTDACFVAPRS